MTPKVLVFVAYDVRFRFLWQKERRGTRSNHFDFSLVGEGSVTLPRVLGCVVRVEDDVVVTRGNGWGHGPRFPSPLLGHPHVVEAGCLLDWKLSLVCIAIFPQPLFLMTVVFLFFYTCILTTVACLRRERKKGGKIPPFALEWGKLGSLLDLCF